MNPRYGLVIGAAMASLAAVALAALAVVTVGGFSWAAVVADPLLAAGFLALSRRSPGTAPTAGR